MPTRIYIESVSKHSTQLDKDERIAIDGKFREGADTRLSKYSTVFNCQGSIVRRIACNRPLFK
jgi:hypothetical protein